MLSTNSCQHRITGINKYLFISLYLFVVCSGHPEHVDKETTISGLHILGHHGVGRECGVCFPLPIHVGTDRGVAGLVVDIALFPIDTVKTRLQSERGFWRSGGFKGIYKGLAPAAAGSAPTAALFFCVYEGCKFYLEQQTQQKQSPAIHMFSASVAEIVACLIRVPVEIAKQRRQALISKGNSSAIRILWDAYKSEGIRKGIYRGYLTTILREVPFSLIQFPLWEFFKANWTDTTGIKLTPFAVALCGACAGGISAAATTPLDLAKTRIMLSEKVGGNRLNLVTVLGPIYRDQGIRGLFAGIVPRVVWITLGGAIFFGFYDLTSSAFRTDSYKM